jgi:hypothetical protein
MARNLVKSARLPVFELERFRRPAAARLIDNSLDLPTLRTAAVVLPKVCLFTGSAERRRRWQGRSPRQEANSRAAIRGHCRLVARGGKAERSERDWFFSPKGFITVWSPRSTKNPRPEALLAEELAVIAVMAGVELKPSAPEQRQLNSTSADGWGRGLSLSGMHVVVFGGSLRRSVVHARFPSSPSRAHEVDEKSRPCPLARHEDQIAQGHLSTMGLPLQRGLEEPLCSHDAMFRRCGGCFSSLSAAPVPLPRS